MPPELREPHRRGLARYLATESAVVLDRRLEITAMRADGTTIPVELAITRIDVPGPPTFTAYLRDITDRRAAESELQASRARIVEAADAARQRLERDLHDGAQQRLVELALDLRMAQAKLDGAEAEVAGLLDAALKDLGEATDALRELARGIHPAALTEGGLGPALQALVVRSTRARRASSRCPSAALPGSVEAAAYFVVAEALTNVARYAGARRVRDRGRRAPRTCCASRCATTAAAAPIPSAGSGLRGLADRVAALDGAARGGAARSGARHDPARGAAMRIVIADDAVLLREGAARLLEDAGFEVVGQAGDADELMRKVRGHRPDVAIVDVRMPPDNADDGLRCAIAIRAELPEVGILLLSQYVEERYLRELLADDAAGVGYLLKDRIADVAVLAEAVRRVAAGGSVLDPEVVAQMLGRSREEGPLDSLTPKEREVLGPDGGGPHEPGDRRGDVRVGARGRAPRDEHLLEARAAGDRGGPSPRARVLAYLEG